MKKRVSAILATLLICTSVFSQEVMAFELPDPSELGKLASEAASGIADAAGTAGGAIADAAGTAGGAIVDAAGQVGEAASDIAGNVGDVVSSAAGQVSDVASGFASRAGEVLSGWGAVAGETADSVKQKLSDAGVKVKTSAEELGSATAKKASELTEQAGETADDAIGAVTDAGGFVVDRAGHVIDLAAAAADYVSSEATEALQVLQRYGTLLMNLAEAAVSGIDLSTQEGWDEAKEAVYGAIENAYEYKFVGGDKISEETVKVVADIVFNAVMYGYQYQNEQITLGEYASLMSEVLICEGIPEGVAYITKALTNNNPLFDNLTKGVSYYLISKAYEDKSGDEIEAEEEVLLEDVAKTQGMTEKES